jgi:hypothetical protein
MSVRVPTTLLRHLFAWKVFGTQNWIDVLKSKKKKIFKIFEGCESEKMEAVGHKTSAKSLRHIFPWKLLSTQNWIDVSHYCQEKNTCFKKNRINQKIFQILEDCDSEKMEAVGQQTSATDRHIFAWKN